MSFIPRFKRGRNNYKREGDRSRPLDSREVLPYRERYDIENPDRNNETRGALTLLPGYSHQDFPCDRSNDENIAGTLYREMVDYNLLYSREENKELNKREARLKYIRERLGDYSQNSRVARRSSNGLHTQENGKSTD